MRISRDAVHDSLSATYQSLEASILNRALSENGISDPEQRKAIVASFLFHQGVFLEQCWFEDQGGRWHPGLYFSTRPHRELEESTVQLPSTEYGINLHEYAHGAAEWALEHEDDPGAIAVGDD